MEDRIRKFMEFKGISASELADSIGVQRSNVTHVLKGRNKPSFQFIEKLLQIYPELNAKWLLLGSGNMIEGQSKPRTLFDQVPEPSDKTSPSPFNLPQNKIEPSKPVASEENIPDNNTHSNMTVKSSPFSANIQDQFFNTDKPIERLIVFFSDQTFKVYNPSR